MTDRLYFDKSDPRSPELSCAEGVLTVRRRGGGVETLAFMLPSGLLIAVVTVAGICTIGLLLRVLVKQFSLLPLLMVAVIALAVCPGLYGLALVQGLIFPFRVVYGRGRYHLSNGMVRVRRSVGTERSDEIVIYPVYRRGDWGVTARIRFGGRGWRWPLFPGEVTGTKFEALQQATKLREWLRRTCGIEQVALDKRWGNTEDVRPGEDYER
jgi:hypothetical protein